MGNRTKGAVSSGHEITSKAGARMLEEGGNAFDAVLAAMCASSVAEPVFSSMGGGGFLLASTAENTPVLYDFFTQTPKKRKSEREFFPILADFGTVTQEFHIGRGSIATPGMVKGLYEIHRDLCRLPMDVILAPAIEAARDGVKTTQMQAGLFDIVQAIYQSSPEARALYDSPSMPDKLLREGEICTNENVAAFFDALAREGEGLFYTGDVAQQIAQEAKDFGGHLSLDDLADYQVIKRKPLKVDYKRSHFYTNPAPSTGGLLIAFALELVKEAGLRDLKFGSIDHVSRLSQIMALTNKARIDAALIDGAEQAALKMLHPDFLADYQKNVFGHPNALNGTTHMSVIDEDGNAASLTVSNGEGCGFMLGDTGIMMNNMLGEEDINPHGFNQWPEDVRMCSMMAPTLLLRDDGVSVALGSGGSNRIRTAILQVLVNLLEFAQPLETAVQAPRIHYERGLLNVEPGYEPEVLEVVKTHVPEMKHWTGQNLFFGGVHAVRFDQTSGQFSGVGDNRRAGVALAVS